jgi:hypothetical protein
MLNPPASPALRASSHGAVLFGVPDHISLFPCAHVFTQANTRTASSDISRHRLLGGTPCSVLKS